MEAGQNYNLVVGGDDVEGGKGVFVDTAGEDRALEVLHPECVVDPLLNVLVWEWERLPKDCIPFKVLTVLWFWRELRIVWK